MLYTLGVGFGLDPLDTRQLGFVYEKDLQAVPSMAAILGHPGLWMSDPRSGINMLKVVHAEQKLHLYRPLPVSGVVVAHPRVTRVVDKGAGRGALVAVERDVVDQAGGALLATVEQTSYCRDDGGFATEAQPGDTIGDTALAIPERMPDMVCDLPTRPEMALLYRLSADRNPLHADPEAAQKAGFAEPILHGMATYGVACHAILKACCDYQAKRLQSLAVRFSSQVFPGETLRTEIWREDSHVVFQTRVIERDKIVLSNGRAEISNTST
jgi:acyl dehydratase